MLTRYVFVVLNTLYLMFGSTFLILGLWIAYDSTSFIKVTGFGLDLATRCGLKIDDVSKNSLTWATKATELPDGLVIIGVTIFILSCIGFIGSFPDYNGLLAMYSSLICVLITIEVGIIGVVMTSNSKGSILSIEVEKKFYEVIVGTGLLVLLQISLFFLARNIAKQG